MVCMLSQCSCPWMASTCTSGSSTQWRTPLRHTPAGARTGPLMRRLLSGLLSRWGVGGGAAASHLEDPH